MGGQVTVNPNLPYRITMQNWAPDASFDAVPNLDIRPVGIENRLLQSVILDFIYDTAVYQRWKSVESICARLDIRH